MGSLRSFSLYLSGGQEIPQKKLGASPGASYLCPGVISLVVSHSFFSLGANFEKLFIIHYFEEKRLFVRKTMEVSKMSHFDELKKDELIPLAKHLKLAVKKAM